MKKTIKTLILMIIAIFVMTITVYGADFSVKMETEKQDNEVNLHIILDEINFAGNGMSVIIFDFEYDREIFETVTSKDIIAQNGWGTPTYNSETGTMLILRNDFTKETGKEIVTVKLQQKENTKANKTEIKLKEIQATDAQTQFEADEQTLKVELKDSIFGGIIKTIITVIAVLIALLFILRFLVKASNKRRKRR